jgi:hypothetical protein
VLLAPVVVLGLSGGAAGAGLGIAAAVLSAQQLRKPEGGWAKFAMAVGIEIVAVLLYVGVVVLTKRL